MPYNFISLLDSPWFTVAGFITKVLIKIYIMKSTSDWKIEDSWNSSQVRTTGWFWSGKVSRQNAEYGLTSTGNIRGGDAGNWLQLSTWMNKHELYKTCKLGMYLQSLWKSKFWAFIVLSDLIGPIKPDPVRYPIKNLILFLFEFLIQIKGRVCTAVNSGMLFLVPTTVFIFIFDLFVKSREMYKYYIISIFLADYFTGLM